MFSWYPAKRPRYQFSAKITMIFGISTQKISEKDRDGYQQQKKGMLVPPLSLQSDCTQFFNMYTRKHLRYLISVQKSATRRNLTLGRLYRGGTKIQKTSIPSFLRYFLGADSENRSNFGWKSISWPLGTEAIAWRKWYITAFHVFLIPCQAAKISIFS